MPNELPTDAMLTDGEIARVMEFPTGAASWIAEEERELANAAALKAYRAACLEVDGKLLTAADVTRAWQFSTRGADRPKHIALATSIFAALDKKEGK